MISQRSFKMNRRIDWLLRILGVGLLVGYLAYAILLQPGNIPTVADTSQPDLLTTDKHHASVVATTVELAKRYHYRNRSLNNDFSAEILTQYLEELDPQKIYFLASDIRTFESNRYYYDNFLKSGQLDEIFAIYKTYQQRVQERSQFAISMLDYAFDFDLDEQLEVDRSAGGWPINQSAQDELWRRLIKDQLLTLKLDDQDEPIRETLTSRYEQLSGAIAKSNTFDVIETILNSYLQKLDPHSEYFSPHSTSNFRISISQQIEGIGAILRTENKHTVVHEIIRGGPAFLSKNLHKGDRILAVANGTDGTFQNIVGWRIADVVDLIRGPKNTAVNLKVLRADAIAGAPAEEVELIRQTVRLEDQMAKQSTVEISLAGRILQLGVIQLPTFYSSIMNADDSDLAPTSSADDVRRFLLEFQNQHINGLVVDLRGNGGGALQEAVELTSMFIASGPVVQVEDAKDELNIHADNDDQVVYDGPLVVLVDRHSASASEIFAAAIQDYGRGIIVGETTFGKGTLQNLWPLSQTVDEQKIDLGAIKLSTAQFYRVSGISTQHLGVIPDIPFLTNEFITNSGERALDNALPESTLEPPLRFERWHQHFNISSRVSEIRQLNLARMQLNPLMNIMIERDQLYSQRDEVTTVSLNEDIRKQALENDQKERMAYINEVRAIFGLEPTDSVDVDRFPSEQIGDVFLDEAVNVLADLVTLEQMTNRSSS